MNIGEKERESSAKSNKSGDIVVNDFITLYEWIRYLQEILSELFKKRVKLMPHSLSLLRKLSKLCSTNCRASYSGTNADVGIIILKASPSI